MAIDYCILSLIEFQLAANIINLATSIVNCKSICNVRIIYLIYRLTN